MLSLEEMQARESLLCPECKAPFHFHTHSCENGHSFEEKNGVIKLLTQKDKTRLTDYLAKFNAYRKKSGWHITDPGIFPQLPFIDEETAPGFWKAKQEDLRLIKRLLKGKENLKILEIGAWNGWLSHQLVKWGHSSDNT